MLRHRREHFEQFSTQLHELVEQVAAFRANLPQPQSTALVEVEEGANQNTVRQLESVQEQVVSFASNLMQKTQKLKQELSLVEAVPWPRNVLLSDPAISEVCERWTCRDLTCARLL